MAYLTWYVVNLLSRGLGTFLSTLSFAFFFGCQESITDPVFQESGITGLEASKDIASTYPGVIDLGGILFNPSRPNFDVHIDGVVRYKIQIPNPYELEAFTKINLYINAALKSTCPGQEKQNWRVYGYTEDFLYPTPASETEFYILEKSFEVRNSCSCHMKLVLKFKVVKKSIILISKELKHLPDCTSLNHIF